MQDDKNPFRPAACSPLAPQWRAGDDEGHLRPVGSGKVGNLPVGIVDAHAHVDDDDQVGSWK